MNSDTFYVLFTLLRYSSNVSFSRDLILSNLEINEFDIQTVTNIEIVGNSKAVVSFKAADDCEICFLVMNNCLCIEQEVAVGRLDIEKCGRDTPSLHTFSEQLPTPSPILGSATKKDRYLKAVKETTSEEIALSVHNVEKCVDFVLENVCAPGFTLLEMFPAVDQRNIDPGYKIKIKLVVMYCSDFNFQFSNNERNCCGGHVHWVWVHDTYHMSDKHIIKLEEKDWTACCETNEGRVVALGALRAFCDSTVADIIDHSADTTLVMPSVTPLSSVELHKIDNNSAAVGFKRCIKVSKKVAGFGQLLMDPVTGLYSLPPLPPTTVTLTNGEEVPVVYDEQYVDWLAERGPHSHNNSHPSDLSDLATSTSITSLTTQPLPLSTDQSYLVSPNDSIDVLGSSGSYSSIGGVVYRGDETFLVQQLQHRQLNNQPSVATFVDYCIPSAEQKKANLLFWTNCNNLFNDHDKFSSGSLDALLEKHVHNSNINLRDVAAFLRVKDPKLVLNVLFEQYLVSKPDNSLQFRVSSQDIVHGTDLESSLSGGQVTIESSAVSATLPVGGNLSFLPLKPTSLVSHFVSFPAKGKRIVGAKTLAAMLQDFGLEQHLPSFGQLEVTKVGASMGLGLNPTVANYARTGACVVSRPAHVKVCVPTSSHHARNTYASSVSYTLHNQLIINSKGLKSAFLREGDGSAAVYCDAVYRQPTVATDILMVGNVIGRASGGFGIVTPTDYAVK